MIIPTYQNWIRQTALGTFKPRSSELKAIDEAILAYSKATSPYGQEWTANEIRIALEAWKKAKGKDWKTNERNKSRIITDLDLQLPPLKANRIGSGSSAEGKTAEELRHAILFFLANCSTESIPNDLAGFLNDGTDTSSDVQTLVQSANSSGWRFFNGDFYDKDNKKNSFLADLVDKLIDYVKELGSYAATAASFLHIDQLIAEAVDYIRRGLPDLLIQILGGLLSKISTVVEVVKGLAQAGKAAIGVWKSRNLDAAILKGSPNEIIKTVRDQIKNSGYDGVKSAIKAGVLAGLSAIPGAGDIVGAIASAISSVYCFVTKVFDHLKEVRHLKAVIIDAGAKLSNKLYETAGPFNLWFKKTIADLPIVSSYCMTLPLTGSYYGFLTLVSADGSELSYKQLEQNYTMFNDVKVWAKKFVEDHSVKLYSANTMVQHSISKARGEKTAWENMQGGGVDRVGKVAMGMIEKALS